MTLPALRIYGLLTLVALAHVAKSQEPRESQSPCSSPEAAQFDFWVGEWDLTWGDTLKASNTVVKEFGGCVIHESFTDRARGFYGVSLSVYNTAKKRWEQTWVDNQGAYMAFTGGLDEHQMILNRSAIDRNGTPITQRMVFFNITPDSLDWKWEYSPDGGRTWKQNWLIHYKRRH